MQTFDADMEQFEREWDEREQRCREARAAHIRICIDQLKANSRKAAAWDKLRVVVSKVHEATKTIPDRWQHVSTYAWVLRQMDELEGESDEDE